jgi:alanine-glyoxylate transaminase/serine-glyoxylate transaminase/serine-pyruvate transaminase
VDRVKLMIPGPVDTDEELLSYMSTPTMPHYGPAWMEIFNDAIDCLKKVFQTENDLYIMTVPGTGALDAALGSLLATGEKVLVPSSGFFGERLAQIARGYGLEPVVLDFPLGQPASAEAVRERLAEDKDIQAVAVVQHETSTGVINPLKEIAAAANEYDRPIIVDAVSSMGGMSLPVDEWGIDLCITVGNKCLETPPAVAAISISQRAWDIIESKPNRNHGWYLDLQTWKWYVINWGSWHPYPVTMATSNIITLQASLHRILEEGLENHFARYTRASRWIRDGLQALGFEMFVEDAYASPLTTAVKARPEFPVVEMITFLREEHGVMVAGGLDGLAGKIFRVGNMGRAASRDYVMAFLFGVEDFLRRKGLKTEVGKGLAVLY